ncbi:MAG: hypothetical protein L6Q55_05655 [Azonexus sp.]|nr:hypothetical protein [Azonexus sp.]
MPLDINTLLVVTVANILALAAVSPAVMGQRLDPAARAVRWSLGVHAASWVCMIASNFWPETLADRLLSTLAVGGFAASNGLLFEALRHWLGKRRFRRAVWGLAARFPWGMSCSLVAMPCASAGQTACWRCSCCWWPEPASSH